MSIRHKTRYKLELLESMLAFTSQNDCDLGADIMDCLSDNDATDREVIDIMHKFIHQETLERYDDEYND